MRLARERGATVLAVTNIMGSQATRDADGVLFTRAGPGDRRRGHEDVRRPGRGDVPARRCASPSCAARCPTERLTELVAELKRIPHCIGEMLEHGEEAIERVADAHYEPSFFLYLGRHVGLPVALEGALKLKEISYIATDAYAAGEMKHGPIALLDEDTPVVVVATDSPGAREGRLQHAGGPRPRRARDRGRDRGRRGHRRARRGDAARAARPTGCCSRCSR